MDTNILKPLYSFTLDDSALVTEWLPSKFATQVSGKYLFCGLASGELALCHFGEDGYEPQVTNIDTDHMLGVQVLCWGPDFLATGSQDGIICLWEAKIENSALSIAKKCTLKAASSWVSDLVWFSVQGMSLLASASGKIVQLWNPLDGSLIHSFSPVSSTVTSIAYSKGMRSLLGGCYAQVHLWDIKDLSKLSSESYHQFEDKESFLKICTFPDTCTVACGMQDPLVDIWSIVKRDTANKWVMATSGNPKMKDDRNFMVRQNQLSGYYEKASNVDVDSSGRLLATAGKSLSSV